MEFKKELIETIKENKASQVFINEAGEWLFFPREGYSAISVDGCDLLSKCIFDLLINTKRAECQVRQLVVICFQNVSLIY